ncbi:hemolysin family protein [bacterium]|nr:hemolysin family protein [bacterium]MBU1677181.1 hemolysin family protein [bacterium]
MLELLLMISLLLLSAGFSGSETALFSLSETELAGMREEGGHAGRRVVSLLRRPPRLLAALLIGNILVNTAASVLATSLLVSRLGGRGLAVAVPAMTVLVLLAGEITPKLVALRDPRRLSLFLQLPVSIWLTVIRPLLHLVDRAGEALLSHLPLERTGSRQLTVPELVTATGLAVRDASLTETEGRFVSRLLQLEDLDVREIMTPRTAAVTLGEDSTRAEILRAAEANGLNRFPVLDRDGDRPVGAFHVKDLLIDDAPSPVRRLKRAPIFVPESKSVAGLLNELRECGQHMAFVVDEHGDFSGLATLEDCIEALTGPWRDETDSGAPQMLQVAERNWVAAGGVDLRRVNEACGTHIAASHDYVTLAGYVMSLLGRVPLRGDRINAGGFRFTILEMDGLRVSRIRVQRLASVRDEGGHDAR